MAQQPPQPPYNQPPNGYPPQPPHGYYPPQQPYRQPPQSNYIPQQPYSYQQPQGFYPGPPMPKPRRPLGRNPWAWGIGFFLVLCFIIGFATGGSKTGTTNTTPTPNPVAGNVATSGASDGAPIANTITQAISTTTVATNTRAPIVTANVKGTQTALAASSRTAVAASGTAKFATQAAQGAIAKATADRSTFLTWAKTHAPPFPKGLNNTNGVVGVTCCATMEYRQSINDAYTADSSAKYIVLDVTIDNRSKTTFAANSNFLTLIALDGYAAAANIATFALNDYLPATNLPPGSYTGGFVAFLMPADSVPAKLVWRSSAGEVTIGIVDP